MQLFVRHVATKKGMLSVLKPMMSSNAELRRPDAGRAQAAATKLLEAGVAAGTVRSDVNGDDLRARGQRHLHVDRPGALRGVGTARRSPR